jgi:hypothetical protein
MGNFLLALAGQIAGIENQTMHRLQPVEAASYRKFAGENNIFIYVESSMGCTCSLI